MTKKMMTRSELEVAASDCRISMSYDEREAKRLEDLGRYVEAAQRRVDIARARQEEYDYTRRLHVLERECKCRG